MAKIIDFPSLQQRMLEQTGPAISAVMKIVLADAQRHLEQNYPKLLEKYGFNLVRVWASFTLTNIASVAYKDAIEALGSKDKYFDYLLELDKIK